MNYVPLEFMDAVLSRLRDLCTTRGRFVDVDELDVWNAAIDRQTSTRQVVDVFIACNEHPSSSLKCVFRIFIYYYSFEHFKAMDKTGMQIQRIFLQPPKDTINSPITVSEITSEILPLVNWAELQVDSNWTDKMSKLMEVLGEVEFSKICSQGCRFNATITPEFMIEQLRGGHLKSCMAWPASSSAELLLAIEEFLITQPFQKVELPRFFVGDVEMIRRLFHSPCNAHKLIYWETLNSKDLAQLKLFRAARDQKMRFSRVSDLNLVWRREDNVEVTIHIPNGLQGRQSTTSCLMWFSRL